MKKGLALFSAHVRICIAEDETNGREEITFAGTIATHNHIVLGRKRLNNRLILVAIDILAFSNRSQTIFELATCDSPFEALDNNLLNVHLDEARDAKSTLITTQASRSQHRIRSQAPVPLSDTNRVSCIY